jgi:hypothetical protein
VTVVGVELDPPLLLLLPVVDVPVDTAVPAGFSTSV